uniref:Uncharacterized protein n=1 Tax=mine drainage metagenome TaxID=410659 RepID=E6PYY1_9ZZZZ
MPPRPNLEGATYRWLAPNFPLTTIASAPSKEFGYIDIACSSIKQLQFVMKYSFQAIYEERKLAFLPRRSLGGKLF